MALFTRLISALRNRANDSAEFIEIEQQLLKSDLGIALSRQIIEKSKAISNQDVKTAIRSVLAGFMLTSNRELSKNSAGLTSYVIVGVNGSGKTTFSAKLANFLITSKVLNANIHMAACDTFRAAAVSQLKTWSERLSLNFISGADNADPAAVAYSAVKDVQSKFGDTSNHFLIVDTAGRLHTNSDLVAELEKILRTINKLTPVNEVLLVIDGSTGQNGLAQAKLFQEKVKVTGLVLTKMDGQGKGGIALAIENELKIPIKFNSTGESATDLEPFSVDRYISRLLED